MNESWHIYISYVFIKVRRVTHSVVVRRDLSHIMSKGGACKGFCENRVSEVGVVSTQAVANLEDSRVNFAGLLRESSAQILMLKYVAHIFMSKHIIWHKNMCG